MMPVIHHDLVRVPLDGGPPGIFWLRLLSTDTKHVVVVTEVPGNPSRSVTNAIEEIAGYIGEQFGLTPHQIVLFQIWPRRRGDQTHADVKRVHLAPSLQWVDSSRGEIEALVGAPLVELPGHADLYRRVSALGGGVAEDQLELIFEAVQASDLPLPHNLSRCRHRARFAEMVAHGQRVGVAWEEAANKGSQAFMTTLTAENRQSCTYHHANWRRVADMSVEIIASSQRLSQRGCVAAAESCDLPSEERDWLVSLFVDPIIIRPDGYTNGQHRACAIRFSGALSGAAVTHVAVRGQESADWTYEGDG